jgi:hypothetical protein
MLQETVNVRFKNDTSLTVVNGQSIPSIVLPLWQRGPYRGGGRLVIRAKKHRPFAGRRTVERRSFGLFPTSTNTAALPEGIASAISFTNFSSLPKSVKAPATGGAG